MCRFTAYLGAQEILLGTLIENPENSLIKQSKKAKMGLHHVNADGFGIAWYQEALDNQPGIFKSIQPAWNNNNLHHIAKKIQSSCFLSHVRASTIGDVSENNCHPFAFEHISMVHNGTIRGIDQMKKEIFNKLDEDLFLSIKGNTDSEIFFHLIIHFYRQSKSLEQALVEAIAYITEQERNKNFSEQLHSKINIALTDGKTIFATRYSSLSAPTLNLSYVTEDKLGGSIVISSEPLDEEKSWITLPEQSYLCYDVNKKEVRISPLL